MSKFKGNTIKSLSGSQDDVRILGRTTNSIPGSSDDVPILGRTTNSSPGSSDDVPILGRTTNSIPGSSDDVPILGSSDDVPILGSTVNSLSGSSEDVTSYQTINQSLKILFEKKGMFTVLEEGLKISKEESSIKDKKIATLVEELDNKDQQIATLNEELNNKDQQIATLVEELDDKDQQIATLVEELNNKDQQIETLTSINEAFWGLNEKVEDKYNKIEAIRMEKNEEFIKLRNLLTRHYEEINVLKRQNNQLERDNQNYKENVEDLITTNEVEQTKHSKLLEDLQLNFDNTIKELERQHQDIIKDFKSKQPVYQNTFSGFERLTWNYNGKECERCEKVNEELKQFRKHKEIIDNENVQLKKKIETLEKEKVDLQNENNRLRDLIGSGNIDQETGYNL